MKKTLLLLLSGSFCLSISGQITRENNSVRNGDEIIKQQMQYKDPGRSGENVIWDFSMLKAVNPKFADAKAVNEKTVYNNNLRLTPTGGNDYWESAVVRPDVVLRDLIHIFHPELVTDSLYYYRHLE